MADSKLPPRYVGYRRKVSTVPQSRVAGLMALQRCRRTFLFVFAPLMILAVSRLFDLHFESPVYRTVSVALLLWFMVELIVRGPSLFWAPNLKRWIVAIAVSLAVLEMSLILHPARSSVMVSMLTILLAFLSMASSVPLNEELKRNGFKSWRELNKEVRRVQELERQNYVPPVPANLYTGEPPRLP